MLWIMPASTGFGKPKHDFGLKFGAQTRWRFALLRNLTVERKIECMTTRAGATGLLTGGIISIFFYLLMGTAHFAWIAAVATVLLIGCGGWLAARWSGAGQPWRCAALGATAGGLAGSIVFCLWGAAAAGSYLAAAPVFVLCPDETAGQIGTIVSQTAGLLLVLLLGGSCLGAVGGWLACTGRRRHADSFAKSAPQMAMNVSITAVAASVFAAAVAAAVFPRLAEIVGRQASCVSSIAALPLAAALLLVVISQFALTLIIPHEAHQAEHRSGMDEVKMAAFVDIATTPVLALLLWLVDKAVFASLPVLAVLTGCTAMSLASLRSLLKLVLPGRRALAAPQEGRQKIEARMFGSIAHSVGTRLVVLCIGCGLAMVLPLYTCVIAVLINLRGLEAERLFLTQGLVSLGLMVAAAAVLSAIYLFYLWLGRWFHKRNRPCE